MPAGVARSTPSTLVPRDDQSTIGVAKASATMKRLRMSRAIASIDIPAAAVAASVGPLGAMLSAAVSAAGASAPSRAIGSQMWPGTERPAQW